MMVINCAFEIGDIVYLKTDPEQNKRIVVGMFIYPGGIYYTLGFNDTTYNAYEIEISKHPDQNMILGIGKNDISNDTRL